ncbi:MAG: hypothetical protein R3B45_03240 [Bdellovibrionota bacterium]
MCRLSTFWLRFFFLLLGLGLNIGVAYGKKNRREGFNFGTGVKVLSADDRMFPSSESDKQRYINSTSQAFSPYFGFSNCVINAGLRVNISEVKTHETERPKNNVEEKVSDSSISTKSANLFTRFLFGKILFLEAGIGVYSEKQKVSIVSTNATGSNEADSGSFTGEKEEYEIDGSGPGYHLGGGFEVATGAGFYFYGSYLNEIYQINEGTSIFGSEHKQAYKQRRELQFGLSHYYN